MTSDVCIQELVTKVLCCCQDVLKPFLSSLSATYEPRLSMPWVANMNLVTKVRKTHVWRYTYMYMYICSVCISQTSSLGESQIIEFGFEFEFELDFELDFELKFELESELYYYKNTKSKIFCYFRERALEGLPNEIGPPSTLLPQTKDGMYTIFFFFRKM